MKQRPAGPAPSRVPPRQRGSGSSPVGASRSIRDGLATGRSASIGARTSGANLVRVARARVAPRAAGRRRTSRVADEEQRDQGVVGVRLEHVGGIGVGGPGEAEDRGRAAARRPRRDAVCRAGAARRRWRGRRRSRRRGAAGRSSQLPAPGQGLLEGDVGVVVDRPVGVALGDVLGEVVRRAACRRRSGRRRPRPA